MIVSEKEWVIWLIYFACMIPFVAASSYIFKHQQAYGTMKIKAYGQIIMTIINLMTMLAFLIYGLVDKDYITGLIKLYNPSAEYQTNHP